MDYEGRIVKLEVNMDTLKEELTLLRAQVSTLGQKIEEFHAQVNRRMDDQRDHTDAVRDHTDALRDRTDRRFDQLHAEMTQLRRDHERLIYWVCGFTITNLVAISGWVLKAAGVF